MFCLIVIIYIIKVQYYLYILKNEIKDLKQLIDHPQGGDDFFHDDVDKFHAEREKVRHTCREIYQKGIKSGFLLYM